MTDHKLTPDGFSIWHCRHGGRWCWRQILKAEETKRLGHDVERRGFRTRPAAVSDIYSELAKRDQVTVAANPDASQIDQNCG